MKPDVLVNKTYEAFSNPKVGMYFDEGCSVRLAILEVTDLWVVEALVTGRGTELMVKPLEKYFKYHAYSHDAEKTSWTYWGLIDTTDWKFKESEEGVRVCTAPYDFKYACEYFKAGTQIKLLKEGLKTE